MPHESNEGNHEGENRFRRIAESLPLILWSANAAGEVDYQTRSLLELTGRAAEDLQRAGWLEVLHPEDRESTIAAWSRSVETGEPYQVEFRIRRQDGDYRWHLTQAVPFRDPEGAITRWYGSSTDIHDRREAEREAGRLAERLTGTLESITDAFCLLDDEWRFGFVNREAERLLGRARADLLGEVVWQRFPSLLGSLFEEECRSAVEDGVTAAFRYCYPPAARWFEFRAYPSSEGLAVYFRDVTAERETELRLREQAELLDRAQDGIIVEDLDHTVVYWNAGAERIYGWDRTEVSGRSLETLLYPDPETREAAVRELLEQGEWRGELKQLRKDGSSILVEARWSLVRNEDGEPHRILAINTDITQRSKLLAQVFRAQRMESIGTLAGGIAHDLNNVLAPILLSIGMLKEEIEDDELREVLGTIEASAERGAEMVKQVLAFSRGIDGAHDTVDLTRILDDIGRVVRDTFPRNVTLRRDIPDDLWRLVADPAQLHQVFMNLIVNARDAMPSGGTITVSAENVELDEHYAAMSGGASPGPHVRIAVTDTGTGMEPQVLDRIFEPFFTTKQVGQGTGLGLSTVAAIVRSHGGVVNAYSEPGSGTMFRIYFPATARDGNGGEETVSEEPHRGKGELILVVDDESSVREITRQTLEAFGYRVVTATDGADAAAAYGRSSEEVAVVLTDLMMPIMDGPTTIRALQRMNPEVRIVAASGLGGEGGVLRAAEAGVRHFLPKPYTADALLRKIHDVLSEDGEG